MNAQQTSTTAAKMHPVSIPLDPSIATVSRGSLAMDDYVQVQFAVLFIFLDYCVEVILKFRTLCLPFRKKSISYSSC